jgi:hypothetical protein
MFVIGPFSPPKKNVGFWAGELEKFKSTLTLGQRKGNRTKFQL